MKYLTTVFNDMFNGNLDKFERQIDNFMNDIYKDVYVPSFQLSTGSYPKVNVIEKEKEFEIVAAVPGLKKEDLEVHLKDGMLTIKGKSNQDKKKETDKYICREIKKSSFARSFRIDVEELDIDNITSSYDLGELRILVPKKEEIPKKEESREIKIE